jgi:hypothetical protein
VAATGGYTTMYITCWILGIMAFLVAMTFRPFPKSRTALAAA